MSKLPERKPQPAPDLSRAGALAPSGLVSAEDNNVIPFANNIVNDNVSNRDNNKVRGVQRRRQTQVMVTLGLRVPQEVQQRWITGCKARGLAVGPTGAEVLAAYMDAEGWE